MGGAEGSEGPSRKLYTIVAFKALQVESARNMTRLESPDMHWTRSVYIYDRSGRGAMCLRACLLTGARSECSAFRNELHHSLCVS